MNIALIGYGKMGKAIERIAFHKGHDIISIISEPNQINTIQKGIDIAIEFTQPESAFNNLKYCIENQIPVISGTTGWINRLPEIENLCKENNGTFLYASNFSIGVNLFFELNKWLAKKMNQLDYKVGYEGNSSHRKER